METAGQGIKEMREKMQFLARETRKLLAENPGSKMSGVQAEIDSNFAEIDSLERRINAAQKDLDAGLSGLSRAEGIEWRNPENGAKIPVAFANKGSFRD